MASVVQRDGVPSRSRVPTVDQILMIYTLVKYESSLVYIHIQVLLERNSTTRRTLRTLFRFFKSKFWIKIFSSSLCIYLQVAFDNFQNHQTGEPQEHHLGEVLQVRSKYKYDIILSYLIVFLFSSSFCNPNYLEIKNYLISKFLAPMFQNISIGNFQTS